MNKENLALQLFCHPKIYTMEEKKPVVQWMLVRGDRILATGRQEEPYPQDAKNLVPINLEGKCVLPGFTDGHCHLHQYLYRYIAAMPKEEKQTFSLPGEYARWMDFSLVQTKEMFLEKIAVEASFRNPGEWILGGGWSHFEILPHRKELDSICPQNPLFLRDVSLHSALLNSRALEIAEISSESYDPKGGRIDRDAHTHEPAGLLLEDAVTTAQKKIPSLSKRTLSVLTARAMKYLNQYGIVGIHDMESTDCYEIFTTLSWLLLQSPQDFTVRCLCSLTSGTWKECIQQGKVPGLGNELLRIGYLKLIHDGSLGARTAYMNTAYPNSEYRGEELLYRGEIRQIIKEALKRNIPLAIHAIGDRATQNIAEIFAELRPQKLSCGMMHRIEHIQSATPSVIESLAKSGIAFSVQPIHISVDLKNIAFLQPHLMEYTHAYRDMLNFGKEYNVPLVLGTDFPVASINPFFNIYAATTRSLSADILKDKNCLTRKEAIEAYTCAPAKVSGEFSIKGSLHPGKLADFISISHDIFEEKEEEFLLQTQVKATYLGGKCVYKAKN